MPRPFGISLIAVTFLITLASPAISSSADVAVDAIQVGPTIEAKHGVVVSVCPIASKVGCEVLKKGGNAVEASIATAFALAVTWPEAGNIGGGGFMMVYLEGGRADFIDYRETAPIAVRDDTFSKQSSSYLLAGTPGTVRGMEQAFSRYGSKKVAWKNDLVMPAVELAERGFDVSAALAASLNSGLKNAEKFPEFRRVYGKPGGGAWQAGDRLVLPELSKTLRNIAEKGADAFYTGEIANLIAAEIKRGGGLMTANDLKSYTARLRTPLRGRFNGYEIHAPPPPSSGGVAMLQILGMLEESKIAPVDRWTPRTSHILVEATRRAFAERAQYLGDPDFEKIDIPLLLDRDHIRAMAKTIEPEHASKSEDVAPWIEMPKETGGQTTHFSVVDNNGMAVSNTYTLEQSFGGKIVVAGAGFLLNNELGDFNPLPGVTDRTGRIGTPPNQAIGGKRPLSSMTPTIVTKDGKLVLVVGSPGGRTIINTVTQVIWNRIGFNMTLRDAVDAPRLHHQWFPDAIKLESAFEKQHPEVSQGIKALGHQFGPTVNRQGDAHSISIDPATGIKTGVADKRIGGGAAGY